MQTSEHGDVTEESAWTKPAVIFSSSALFLASLSVSKELTCEPNNARVYHNKVSTQRRSFQTEIMPLTTSLMHRMTLLLGLLGYSRAILLVLMKHDC